MNASSGALQAFAAGIGGSAHNIANISTEKFTPLEVINVEGPHGLGVKAEIRGIKNANENRSGDVITASSCGTDLAKEYGSIVEKQRGFEANVKALRTQDDLLGTILDISP